MSLPAPVVEVDLGPGVRAGFTTTGGGGGFNLSLVVGDSSGATANRERLAAWAGAPVVLARQVHGAGVHLCRPGDAPTADALVAADPGTAVAVLVADCVPVLLADPLAGVVGAVHAGRRGLVAGVVPATVAAMTSAGAVPGRLRAVVGPAICGACYEVPADLQREVDDAVPGTVSTTSWGTPALDLPGGVCAQLAAADVTVTALGCCTLEDDRWYSHRGSGRTPGRAPGRFAGVVRLLG